MDRLAERDVAHVDGDGSGPDAGGSRHRRRTRLKPTTGSPPCRHHGGHVTHLRAVAPAAEVPLAKPEVVAPATAAALAAAAALHHRASLTPAAFAATAFAEAAFAEAAVLHLLELAGALLLRLCGGCGPGQRHAAENDVHAFAVRVQVNATVLQELEDLIDGGLLERKLRNDDVIELAADALCGFALADSITGNG